MKKLVSTALLLAFAVSPAAAFAKEGEKSEVKKMKGDFCENIGMLETKMTDKKTKRTEKHDERESEHEGKVEDKRSEMDKKRSEKRAEMEKKMSEKFEKAMSDDKLTAEQKAAILAARPQIDAAWAAKNSDVDAAIAQYRSEMTVLKSGEKAKLAAAMKAFDASALAAITKAKSDCAAGIASKTVAASFRADMQAAHAALKAVRDTVGLKNPEVKALRDGYKDDRKETVTESRGGFRSFWKKLFGKKDHSDETEVEVEDESSDDSSDR